jgi:Subtilase family
MQALEHAVSVWKVDIISMSFAISKNDKKTKDAMTAKFQAIKDQVLLFAAASNSGRKVGRAYPAKRNEVFSIHAAYGGGGAWRNNPKPHMLDFNFSTLGMYVEAPHEGQETKRVSGTSVAAPIAAGIAALVLEFCRQPLVPGQGRIKRPERLKSKLGMAKIFLQMYDRFELTRTDQEDNYFHMRPWGFMALKGSDGDAFTARQRIAMTINEALGSLDD